MNWYERKLRKQAGQTGSDAHQDWWEEALGDVQRYLTDPYECRVYITDGPDKISVSITLIHIFMGVVSWQDFWKFGKNERSAARATFKKVSEIAEKIVGEFGDGSKPTQLLHTYLREACRFIDPQHKPTSRIPHIDWAREQEGETDWRNSLYGNRYPTQDIDGF
jgi:hypothetical protein